jgi:hypothetical protein
MSNLVPTPRVNKHGRTVIKHMRSEAATAPYSSAPAPSLPSITGTEHAEAIGNLQVAMKRAYALGSYRHTNITTLNDLWDRAEFMSMELASAYAGYIDADPDNGIEDLLMSALNTECDEQSAGYILFIAQHVGILDKSWNFERGANEGFIHAYRMHRGLKSFDIPENILSAAPGEQARVVAAFKVTQAVFETDSRGIINQGVPSREGSKFYLSQPRLTTLAMERHDESDTICEIIRERKVIDPDTIEHLLATGIPALRDGAL